MTAYHRYFSKNFTHLKKREKKEKIIYTYIHSVSIYEIYKYNTMHNTCKNKMNTLWNYDRLDIGQMQKNKMKYSKVGNQEKKKS